MRGLTTVMTYKFIEKPENINEETLRLARTLGWCAEIVSQCSSFKVLHRGEGIT